MSWRCSSSWAPAACIGQEDGDGACVWTTGARTRTGGRSIRQRLFRSVCGCCMALAAGKGRRIGLPLVKVGRRYVGILVTWREWGRGCAFPRYTDQPFISACATGMQGVSREALPQSPDARTCPVMRALRRCRVPQGPGAGANCRGGELRASRAPEPRAAMLCGRDGVTPPAGLLSAGGCTSVRMAGDCVFLHRAGWFSW